MRSAPEAAVFAWVAAQRRRSLYTTSVNKAEILYGIAALPRGRRRTALAAAAAAMFSVDFAGRVLPFDGNAAGHFAEIVAARRRAGRPIEGFDAQIAAIAAACGAELATRDTQGFADCGVVLIDPWNACRDIASVLETALALRAQRRWPDAVQRQEMRRQSVRRWTPPRSVAPGSAANWRQTLWAMVAIQFVTAVANSVLTPIMPLFLPELGVTGTGEIAIWAGILGGSTSFVAAFTSPIWGRLSDRHGRKVMLIRSSIAIGIFTGLMGVAVNVWQMFAFRGLMGIFAGSRPPRSRWSPARCPRTGSAIRSAGSVPASSSGRWSAPCLAGCWPI